MTGAEVLLALQIAAAAAAAVGAVKAASASRKADQYDAAVSTDNAIAARQNAAAEADRADRERRLRAGANIARVGGSGVTMAGSVLDVLEDNTKEEELNKLRILHQGEINAIGFERGASLSTSSAKSTTAAGGVATAVLGAAGSINKYNNSTTSGLGKNDALGQPRGQPMGT